MDEPVFCQTVGLELEVTDVDVSSLHLPNSWRITNDASVESDAYVINGIPIINYTEAKSLILNKITSGGEILSSLIDTSSNYLVPLKSLCNTLIQRGEPYQSERAGLHVHLSFVQPNLKMLKAIIRLGCHLEDAFFLIGGMGYDFRGKTNDCSYCRPITTPGPQVIQDYLGDLYPCLVVDDLLEAETVDDFWVRLGDFPSLHMSKYVPIRYHWLNLYNLLLRKHTLEFRIFNKSLKPRYIEAAIEFCKAFGDAVLYYYYNQDELEELEFNSVYDHRNKMAIVNTIISFASSRLKPHVLDNLLRIADTTPIESIRFPKQPYWFHLRFHRHGDKSPIHWNKHNYRPSISYSKAEVQVPRFVDIHNLRNTEEATPIPTNLFSTSFTNSMRHFSETTLNTRRRVNDLQASLDNEDRELVEEDWLSDLDDEE